MLHLPRIRIIVRGGTPRRQRILRLSAIKPELSGGCTLKKYATRGAYELMRCEIGAAASHRVLRRGLQQFLQLLLVEFCVAGGEMTARLRGRRHQIKFSVFD